MKRLLLIPAFLLLAFPLFADIGNRIHTIEPAFSPVAGDAIVVITGDFSREPITSPPCFGANVYIGGKPAEVISFATDRIEIRTPPYVQGRFDVIVDRCSVAEAVAENAFIYGEPWERVLLPVRLREDVPGAFGSLWRTELAGMNLSGAVRITAWPSGICVIPEGCPLPAAGPLGESVLGPSPHEDRGPGQLHYLLGNDPSDVSFTLRVRDVSREAESLGTELRTVREDDAFGPNRFFSIPDVPPGTLYRHKLRLYRLDTAEAATLIVRVIDRFNQPIAEHHVTLAPGIAEEGFVLDPPYAEIDLESFPRTDDARRAVMIQTPAEGLYWGFLSVTNNATQLITTVTP